MAMRRSAFPALAGLAALALLAGCHRQEGRGGLTADQDRQLDNAAAMLEANAPDLANDDMAVNAADLDGNVDENAIDID
jgi:hypothetical protein